ncbi:MAG: TRAP transporter substrate-binding protein [Firmicutes bacterium]|nr:TRAP transporter substrate-binding protein [Bacillota bacterium]
MRKKTVVLLIVAVLAVAAAALATVVLRPKDDPVVRLNLAHFFPAAHPVEKDLVQPWIAAVAEATGGRVQITSYPGETLANAAEIYSGVISGVADIGISCFAYTRGRFPVLEVFELPGITYLNAKVAGKVAWEGINLLDPEEVKDTRLLMVFSTGPGALFSKPPVRNLKDLQGMTVRATGLSARTLETLGASPVAMAQPEAYEALARGIVQGNLAPLEVLEGWRHAEVTDYVTLTPFLYNTLFFMTMNHGVWERLSPELQEIFSAVTEEYLEKVAYGLWDWQNESALRWAVEETGMQVIELPAEETERWIEMVKPVQDDFVEKIAKMGIDGETVLRTVKELADRYNQVYGNN